MMSTVVPVLMYHHITPKGGSIAATPEHFESQLKMLSQEGYHSLTAQQFEGFLKGESVPKKSILITFDDGYLNNWVYAHPLLKKYGFHAVIFVVTADIGQGDVRPYWQDGTQRPLPDCPTHEECKQLRAKGGDIDAIMLRWSEIQAMQEAGTFEAHSHTHTHTRWDLVDPSHKNDKMREELTLSRVTLKEHLGLDDPYLCWPQGYFDADYVAIAQQVGFRMLFTTKAFGFNKAGTNPLYVYRFAVSDRPGQWLKKRLFYAYDHPIGRFFNAFKAWKKSNKAKRQQKKA